MIGLSDEALLERARALRFEVFCREQGVSAEDEHDGLDAAATHLAALDGEALVGTCRLLLDGDRARVQRVAVTAGRRGEGIGAALMAAAERELRARALERVELHAQTGSEPFYERLGYERHGARFWEAGIEHVTMRREPA